MAINTSLNTATTPISPSAGGTGVNNGSFTITATFDAVVNQDVTTTGSPSFFATTVGELYIANNSIEPSVPDTNICLVPTGIGSVLFSTINNFNPVYPEGVQSAVPISSLKLGTTSDPSNFTGFVTRSSTPGVSSALLAGDHICRITGYGDDGTGMSVGGKTQWLVDATPSAGIMPCSYYIYTTDTFGVENLGFALTNTSQVILAKPLLKSSGGTGVNSATTVPAASHFAAWDAHLNMSANNFLEGFAETATVAGTTTLTVASAKIQYFTGSTTQTVVMPVVSTLVLGQSYTVTNNSTGNIAIQSSGLNAIYSLIPGETIVIVCVLTSGTSAASWNVILVGGSAPAPSITTVGISGTTQSADVNTRYIVENAAQTTITLPTVFAIGDVIAVKGFGAGGWIVVAGTGNTILIGQASTSVSGTVTSANNFDVIYLSGLVANTTWSMDSSVTSGFTIA